MLPENEVRRLAMKVGLYDKVDCSDDYFIPARADFQEIKDFAQEIYLWTVMRIRCNDMLERMIGAANVKGWWESPNKALDMKRPIDAPIAEVYSYVYGHFQK